MPRHEMFDELLKVARLLPDNDVALLLQHARLFAEQRRIRIPAHEETPA